MMTDIRPSIENFATDLLPLCNSLLATSVSWQQQQKMNQCHPDSPAFLKHEITFFVIKLTECNKSLLIKIRQP
jgi:hypothetical protein